MDNNVSLVLVGIGGYGATYLKELYTNSYKEKGIEISGAVDPYPENSDYYEDLKNDGVEFYKTLEDFYDKNKADLAIISSPIQFHSRQSIIALSKGTNVLCEKPIAATLDEAWDMKVARDKYNKFLAIGYQWSYSDAVQNLKKDILAGKLGKAKRLKSIVQWSRDKSYYNRSPWAGKIKDEKGNWILDSVANNATAHYLHNMLYVLGSEIDSSDMPKKITSEIYRANNIENYDTSFINITTELGVEILFLASHAVNIHRTPQFFYEFENANIIFGDPDIPLSEENILCYHKDGEIVNYGNPYNDQGNKMWLAIDNVRNNKKDILCGIEASLAHTITINKIQKAQEDIVNFPSELVHYDDKKDLIYVEGLSDIIDDAYKNWKIPSQMGINWTRSNSIILD